MNFEHLKNPPKKYRPAPFWSWNEKLNTDETLRQIDEMENVGIGGFFMHARGGLQTEYMSKDWFEQIRTSSEKANEKGMLAWGYDENGWPSGFGGGAVNGLGLQYQQKYLRGEITDRPKTTEHTIINILGNDGKNYHIYFDVNPFYVDTLNKEVVKKFLESTHCKYLETLGKNSAGMTGFFTDEPQVSRNGYPWSFILEKEYLKRYNEALTPHLHTLLFDFEESPKVRYRFWKLVRDLFVEGYNEQIYNWHKANGLLYTGHIACEEDAYFQTTSNGACMPHYEYMDIPGMDHLFRVLPDVQTEMQLSSVANQLGKKQVMCETFALSGWNVSFEDLRWLYENQMAHGINFLCQHLEGYSLRGIRKRDYPASLFVQQPWWKDYKIFNDKVSRIGYLLAEGEVNYKVLLLHNIESAWTRLTPDEKGQTRADAYYNSLTNMLNTLDRNQIHYHLGDERIMERYGKVKSGELEIGTQSYSVIIVPPSKCISKNTLMLLKEFKAAGGTIIFTEEIPSLVEGETSSEVLKLAENCITASAEKVVSFIPDNIKTLKLEYKGDRNSYPIVTACRQFKDDGMTMYYLVNPIDTRHNLKITVKGKSASIFDSVSGEEVPVYFEKSGDNLNITSILYERGSIVLFVYDDERKTSADKNNAELLPITNCLNDEWEITSDLNSLTLDYCDLYFDGEKKAENLPVSDVQEMACNFRRKVKTDVVFHFNVKERGFNTCRLAVETPEIFDIEVNGNKLNKKDLGFFFDKSFRLIDIKDFVTLGENEIKLSVDFEQSEAVYKNIENGKIFESEKNKLTYDMEIEAIYIVGDFGVKTDGDFVSGDNRALITDGNFYICNMPKTVTKGDIASQGFPFFAGSMTFEQKINLTAEEIINRSFKIDKLSSNVTSVTVNGKYAGKIMWQPYEIDISNLLHQGENTITVTVTGNLRNLLGPFHLKVGECLEVGPSKFFHYSPLWLKGYNDDWTDSYCFVEFGLFY